MLGLLPLWLESRAVSLQCDWLPHSLRHFTWPTALRLGESDMEAYLDPAQVENPTLSAFLIVAYIILTAVMLLNVLIAMVSYGHSATIYSLAIVTDG